MTNTNTTDNDKLTSKELLLQASKSRTVWFSAALAILSVAQGFVFQLNLTPFQEMLLGAFVAAAIAFLRTITTTPLAEK